MLETAVEILKTSTKFEYFFFLSNDHDFNLYVGVLDGKLNLGAAQISPLNFAKY